MATVPSTPSPNAPPSCWVVVTSPVAIRPFCVRPVVGDETANTAGMVDRLEALGLVRGEVHLTDGRARLLTLTAWEELREALDREVFGSVPALAVLDEPERRQLYGLLRRVASA
ncbi:MarR family winged helix-turn-helix transcriptional regulator [Nocardia sp. NPDC004085]